MKPIAHYKTIVFDCDGVILDSNSIKTKAFYDTALPFGPDAAEQLVRHHQQHGGISRWLKFEHFQTNILGRAHGAAEIDALVSTYGDHVHSALKTCAVAERIQALRKATAHARWMVVSGGAQHELRDVFAARDIARHFDGGIFGSPDNKDEILAREIASGAIQSPALFLGDSRYDHEAASRAGLDFIFVSEWTEFGAWRSYLEQNALESIERLADLL